MQAISWNGPLQNGPLRVAEWFDWKSASTAAKDRKLLYH